MKPIIKVPDDYKDPSLRRWQVIEVVFKNGKHSRHIWGHDVTNGAGRVSSPIKEFDRETMTVTTFSGRVYKLIGMPGKAVKGEYVWQNWCQQNNVVLEVDVTGEYFDGDAWMNNPSHWGTGGEAG
jgi:hypothetical protein